MERQTHTIDATGQVLGRLASKIVPLLRGKNKPDFIGRIDSGDFVIVKNAGKIVYTGKKMQQKIYYHHSGYLGGLKEKTLEEVLEKKPSFALRTAVYGMLPKNRIRENQIKRLKIEI
jgi:large subunit ribosomal protein L13